MSTKPSFEARLDACINAMLRDEYPSTYPSIIREVASETAASAASNIIKRNKACKQGVRPLQYMDLPPELRNLVHQYVVDYYHYQYSLYKRTQSNEIGFSLVYSFEAVQPAISRVSRQLRTETLAMFYATNRFVLDLTWMGVSKVEGWVLLVGSWLTSIGAVNARHIKSFTIRYDPDEMPWSVEEMLAKPGLSLVAGVVKLEPEEGW
ncbi:hypothetical protein LTR56_019600 [Elasticomyces elasticus]|nr:hypothetical protein LTR56_019600 [Elasticomyces elasticus]KAK3634466.1 hypothetical protein LTR22_019625 [Elasticomyces elasticus]KAK4917072.1 hypothetical protein LTR49_014975 [Elasticomyces elasticus]KAK5712107.1 hypothetical protein LTR15_012176 [Elasticomyces elasticus]KAK5750742.1 hypothetical protein LTS12_019187 [Elasticomyces elasticus]